MANYEYPYERTTLGTPEQVVAVSQPEHSGDIPKALVELHRVVGRTGEIAAELNASLAPVLGSHPEVGDDPGRGDRPGEEEVMPEIQSTPSQAVKVTTGNTGNQVNRLSEVEAGDIARALSEQDKMLVLVENGLESLAGKLAPALRQEPPTDNGEDPIPGSVCQIASMVRAHNAVLYRVHRLVSDLFERLEV